jgi:hypothetical protein
VPSELELAYRLASEMSQFKGGFLARTSHELRSPLNGLIGMHQLILADLCDSPQEEREFIAQANTSALKMVKMLDHLLEVAKLEHGRIPLNLQPVQLAALLQQVYSATRLQAQHANLRLTIDSPDLTIYVQADPLRLRQVLVNLVDTAIAQTSEGQIRLALHHVDDTYAYLWLEDPRPADSWQEAIDLVPLTPPSVPEFSATTVADASSFSNGDSVSLSPGLTLLVNQILLEQMQGKLELLALTPEELARLNSPQTRLQCSLWLITEPI